MASTDYSPVDGSRPRMYAQNIYTANWLSQIAKSNSAVLQQLKVTQKHDISVTIEEGITLARLCELGANDKDIAWPIFNALWTEITAKGRPPVLVTLDSLSHVLQNSAYRDPDFKLIHSHDLAIVNHFMDCLAGKNQLTNGGAVLAATNRSHGPVSKSLELAIKNNMELKQEGKEITKRDPFEKNYDDRVDKVLKGLEVMKLKGLSKAEARGLMEYWAKSGVLRSRVDERSVTEKWAVAGNGIIGEIERNALAMRI